MNGNAPLSHNFTAPQADFLRMIVWDLTDKDFTGTSDCASELQQIHGISVCIINAAVESIQTNDRDLKLGRTAVERKLYEYENYTCSGYYSGGVLAGSIIGTVIFMLVVGGLMQADEIQDVRKIGGGAFVDVWLVKYRGTQLLASKRLRKVHETQHTTQNFLEIKMAAKFDHPNVVRLIGAAWTVESDLQALSEYMVGGDLCDFLIYPLTSRTWTPQKLEIATDVIEALVYLHSFIPPIVHRDLKSRNILLSREMQAKLTDFGVSRIMSEENTMTQGVGTSRWEAPEVLAGKEDYNQAADIFSFGVVLSELDTHAIPYNDARGPNDNALANVAILQMIAMGVIRPSFTTHCPPDIRVLAKRCLAHNPNDRPSAPEVAYALRTTTLT